MPVHAFIGSPSVLGPLRWQPPGYPNYSGYEQITLAADGSNRSITRDSVTDVLILAPSEFNPSVANLGGVTITGCRNLVWIGGRLRIDNIAASPTQSTQTGIKIRGGAGTFHFEGLDIGGTNLNDAIAFQGITGGSTSSVVQIQNCRIQNQLPAGTTLASGMHPDCIQFQDATGFPGTVRLHQNTFNSVYQGIFTQNPIGAVQVYRTNLRPRLDPNAGQMAHFLFWQETSNIPVSFPDNDVWIEENATNSAFTFAHEVYPQYPEGRNPANTGIDVPTITTDSSGTYVTWPNGSGITGRIYKGVPPGGDFCPAGVPGLSYQSPGYQ